MSHPARLSLRAPPHLPFVQGWPGIPSTLGRKAAAVHGTVEVRIGSLPIKARWVRAEIRKYESAPPGFPSSTTGETWEHVGEATTLWAPPAGKEHDTLQQADFKFYIPLPDNLPPSVDMIKGTGIRYELVAALCYRQKGGVFKKESSPIVKISEEIRITKHDLHSAWPIYNVPDSKSATAGNGELVLNVARPTSAFGPNDRILFTASLRSMRRLPFKLKGFECVLHETIIVTPPADVGTKAKKGKGPPQPIKKTRVLATARQAMDESVGKGGEKSARMDMAVPTDNLLLTVRHARSIRVEYELEVKAVCDSGIPEMSVRGIEYVVGPFARAHAQQAVRDIGHVDALCPGVPPPSQAPSTVTSRPTSAGVSPHPGFTPSPQPLTPNTSSPFPSNAPSPQPPFPPNGFYQGGQQPRNASQPIQGFVANDNWRRKSSGSTITTTTTATYDQHQANGRPQSMHYKPSNPNFPTANPAPGLVRSGTGKTYDSSLPPSSPIESIDEQRSLNEYGAGQNNRYSSVTSNTFGPWDGDLRKAMVKGDAAGTVRGPGPAQGGPSKPPPSAWISAEQEKSQLFDDARNRAVRAQQVSGADLQDIGLDIPTTAPPEYAPRRPELPKEDYKAPERPVSVYTTKSPVAGSSANHTPSATTSAATSPLPVLASLPDLDPPERTAPSASIPASSRLVDNTDRRSDSLPRASQPPAGSSSTRPAMEPAYLSAAEEKEQQRRRFEQAQNRVVSGSSTISGRPSQSLINDRPSKDDPVPYDQIFPSVASSSTKPVNDVNPTRLPNGAVSEKEQIRRYQEAQDRVGRGGSGSGVPNATQPIPTSAPGSSIGHGSSAAPPPLAALSEKEQMRRYYEAQDRVAQAGGQSSGSSFASPPPTMSPTRGGSSNVLTGLAAAIPPAATGLGISGGPPSSALNEKEQMRRFYEAQDRVARAAGGQSSPDAGSSSRAERPVESPTRTAVSTKGSVPPSVFNEKEQMRRFYEAQDRVARAAAGQSSPDAGSSNRMGRPDPEVPRYESPPPIAGSSAIPPASRSTSTSLPRPGGSGSGSGTGSGTGPTPYMSAEQEKEMMRRRFEDAQAAVDRNKRISSPPPPEFQPTSSAFSPPDSPVIRRDPTISAGKAKARTSLGSAASSVPDGPPPPLPTKPPKEYINLLSPVTESGPSFANFGVNGGTGVVNGSVGAGSGSGSGATHLPNPWEKTAP